MCSSPQMAPARIDHAMGGGYLHASRQGAIRDAARSSAGRE
jgi:hypothetical protein